MLWFFLDLSVRQSVGPFFGAAQLFFLICRSGSLSGHFSEQHWWLPWSMVHSVRADPSLNTVLCGGLKPYACARFGGTHGAVDVTSSRLQVPGPKSSIVGFGALRSPSCFIFGWIRPKTLQLPLPRGGCRLPDLPSDAEGICLPDPFLPFLEVHLPDRPLCLRNFATRPSLWWRWVGVDFCFGGRRAETVHYKS